MLKQIDNFLNIIYRYKLPFLFTSLKRKKYNHSLSAIYFYPRLPHKRSILYKMCKHLGIKILLKKSASDQPTFFWDDSTNFEDTKIISVDSINNKCTDISKNKVEEIFKKCFEYDLAINPKSFKGKCVIKSDENATHDGRIIECPIDNPDPKFVYQKVINNSLNKDYVVDYRVPIIGKSIPLVYFKIKTNELRFTNDISRVEVHATNSILSNQEVDNILKFSEQMGLDYGELDVLRDNDNNKIYIVDVNKTPWGPPATISEAKAAFVINKMSSSLLNLFNKLNK